VITPRRLRLAAERLRVDIDQVELQAGPVSGEAAIDTTLAHRATTGALPGFAVEEVSPWRL